MTEGRLFKLRLSKSHAARIVALAAIRPSPIGGYVARFGGQVRGTDVWFSTYEKAQKAVNAHYDAQMMEFVRRRRTK